MPNLVPCRVRRACANSSTTLSAMSGGERSAHRGVPVRVPSARDGRTPLVADLALRLALDEGR